MGFWLCQLEQLHSSNCPEVAAFLSLAFPFKEETAASHAARTLCSPGLSGSAAHLVGSKQGACRPRDFPLSCSNHQALLQGILSFFHPPSLFPSLDIQETPRQSGQHTVFIRQGSNSRLTLLQKGAILWVWAAPEPLIHGTAALFCHQCTQVTEMMIQVLRYIHGTTLVPYPDPLCWSSQHCFALFVPITSSPLPHSQLRCWQVSQE